MWIVDELENAIDIVELVWRYTRLKKAGANYKAVCPFPGHSEKTPSFIVSPAKQLAYCFGCHRWGGVVKFTMDIENASFKESVEILSSFSWVKIDNFISKENAVNKTLYSLYKDATNYYIESLKENKEVYSYFTKRWLTEDSIKTFRLWYADSWINLYNYLTTKWYDEKLIKDSNIFVDIQRKKDKFINRVIFPITNIRWDIVGFAGRILWKWEPKYLNSPASPVYDKSTILYALYQARSEITKQDKIIITEGYMDTITLHQHWIRNSICVSWTALTEKHIPIIKRLSKKIYLCFDNDKAWEQATFQTIELLKNTDVEVKIIQLEWWKDPDEVLEKWGDFQKLIDKAVSPVWYYLNHFESKYDLNSIQDKKNLLKELIWILTSYEDNVEKDFYIKEISKKLDISVNVLYEELKKIRSKRPASNIPLKTNKYSSEDVLIWEILNNPSFVDLLKDKLVFNKELSPHLIWVINEQNEYLKKLDLEERESLKAIGLYVSSKNSDFNTEKTKSNFLELINKLNKDIYKKLEHKYVEMIKQDPDNIAILTKYNDLIINSRKNNVN